MTQLAALVIEDEPAARRYLVELLRGTGAIDRLVAVATAAAASEALERAPRFDVAFVDIRLIDRPGDTTGLDWVRTVAPTPAAPRFVLTTAMAEHAIAAFEAGAVDYLLKPFTRQRVAACVQRVVERHARPPTALPTRLVARTAASLALLPLDGILAFEACERLTYVHHLEGRFLVDPSLSALEAQFGELVLRTHRNWLAARRHVRRLERAASELCLVVGDSLEVPVSRDRAAAVRKELLAGTLGLLR
jgi:DNA-binding LytR/AlgR family response regulator